MSQPLIGAISQPWAKVSDFRQMAIAESAVSQYQASSQNNALATSASTSVSLFRRLGVRPATAMAGNGSVSIFTVYVLSQAAHFAGFDEGRRRHAMKPW